MENKMFHHIKVTAPENGRKRETVELDGKPIRCVSLDYHYDVDSIPYAYIEVSGTENLDIHDSRIILDISPANLRDAVLIVREELLRYDALYNGFLASIMSVLKPRERYFESDGTFKVTTDRGADSLAVEILNRIIGEE